MKTLVLLFFLFHSSIYGQNLKKEVKRLDSNDLINVLNAIESKVYTQDQYAFKIFKKENASGSAGLSESDEISYSYLIAISEFDEYPKQSLFSVGNFINPNILSVEKNEDHFLCQIEAGIKTRRRITSIQVSLHNVSIAN